MTTRTLHVHMVLCLICALPSVFYALAAMAVTAPPVSRTLLLKGTALLIPLACVMSPIIVWNADYAGRMRRRALGLWLVPATIGLHVVLMLTA